jgi:prevent-host-death family protein
MSKPKERRVPAAEFKARCLALLDEVAATHRSVVVTKRGRPVARVVPFDESAPDLSGSIVFEGDLVSPTGEEWDAER